MVRHYNEDVQGFEQRVRERIHKNKTVPKAPFLRTMERSKQRPPKVIPRSQISIFGGPDNYNTVDGAAGGQHRKNFGSFDGRAELPKFAVKHP